MNGLTNQQVIGALVTVLIMSYAAFFAWIVASLRELHSRIGRLDEKFSGKLEALTIAVSRLEGSCITLRQNGVPQPVMWAEGGR